MQTLLVRLKPYDPHRGHVTKRYAYRGAKFQADRGWYRVEEDVADYLRHVRQRIGDEHSPKAFDVMTPADADRLERAEVEESRVQKSAGEAPIVEARPDTSAEPVKRGRGRPRKNPVPDTSDTPTTSTTPTTRDDAAKEAPKD